MKTEPHAVGRVSRRDWLRIVAVGSAAGILKSEASAASASDGGAEAAVVQLTAAQRQALRGVLEEAVTKKLIPGGSLAVLSRGRVVFREAVGHGEFDGEKPFRSMRRARWHRCRNRSPRRIS